MKIIVIGTGYVGLITGLSFSRFGHKVTCIDNNKEIVEKINNGIPTFFENGLQDLLNQELSSGRFKACLSLKECIEEVDLIFVAVGTPSLKNGSINMRFIKQVSVLIGKEIKHRNRFISIIIKSTVLPTTTDTLVREIIEKYSGKILGQFGLGMNPEFLREGSALKDFMEPDRVVIGFEDLKTKEYLDYLYKSWDCEKLFVNTRTAELIKYANNCLLALQISASNEIANLSAFIGNIDIKEVMLGVHLDKRWNPKLNNKRVNPQILDYLYPGCGFGGSCFPKDIKALINFGKKKENEMKILQSVIELNSNQPKIIIRDLSKVINLNSQNIMILGLSFKPDTDDIRESPALIIVRELLKENNRVFLHDPIAIDNFKKEIGFSTKITYSNNWEDDIHNSSIVIILTKWKEYEKLNSKDLNGKIIYDARRLLKKENISCKKYMSIGLSVL
tara:strand:+ start:195 stop:1535 length:1341 start_codon:yes stop_codon:yes gene_type:complete